MLVVVLMVLVVDEDVLVRLDEEELVELEDSRDDEDTLELRIVELIVDWVVLAPASMVAFPETVVAQPTRTRNETTSAAKALRIYHLGT